MKIITEVKRRSKKNEDFSDQECEITQIEDEGVKILLLEIGNMAIKVNRTDLEKAMRVL